MTARNWFITGTSSGFGKSMTQQLLERGDQVFATVRKPESMDPLKGIYPLNLHVASMDVTDATAVLRVVNAAFTAMGRIDVLVNNAGYGLAGAAEEVSDEQVRAQIDTNLLGSIRVIRAALPHLRAQGGGRILQIASMGAHIAFPGLSLYHTTKWGIEGFCESLAKEVAAFNIGVTMVEPGSARTGFFGSSNLVAATPMDAYDKNPVGDFRRRAASGGIGMPGDPDKMVRAMIASVDRTPAPLRLALGSDAYNLVSAALKQRLSDLEEHKDLAFSTDAVA